MAEHPNVALMRKGYKAFAEGDIATLNDLFADDIVWHVGGRSPLAGDYKGKQEVFTFFGKITELTGGTFKLDIHDVLANDDHVVVLVNSSAKRNGKSLSDNGVHVFHVRDGKTVEFWGVESDQYAGDEFFS